MRLAFDTNVILYAFADFRDAGKTLIARGLLDSIDVAQPIPILSTQVLNEFSSVVTRRANISQSALQTALELLLRMDIVMVDEEVILAVVKRTSDHLNFYDALIV
jgi:predicted nucleic acid-binding protein